MKINKSINLKLYFLSFQYSCLILLWLWNYCINVYYCRLEFLWEIIFFNQLFTCHKSYFQFALHFWLSPREFTQSLDSWTRWIHLGVKVPFILHCKNVTKSLFNMQNNCHFHTKIINYLKQLFRMSRNCILDSMMVFLCFYSVSREFEYFSSSHRWIPSNLNLNMNLIDINSKKSSPLSYYLIWFAFLES